MERFYDFIVIGAEARDMALQLVEKYEELQHVDPNCILYINNYSSSDEARKLANVSRIPAMWVDILNQKGVVGKFYMMEFYKKTCDELSTAQLTALMYRELRRIAPDGSILDPDMIDGSCADLLDEGVKL